MADICVAFQRVCETFKIVDLNPFQREAMEYFVKKKVDVFVNLYRLGSAVNWGKGLLFRKTSSRYLNEIIVFGLILTPS